MKVGETGKSNCRYARRKLVSEQERAVFRVSGHFGDDDVELALVRTPRAAITAAHEMQERGRERITIERQATGAKMSVELFAFRHRMRGWRT